MAATTQAFRLLGYFLAAMSFVIAAAYRMQMFSQIADLSEPLLHGVCHALVPEDSSGLSEESAVCGLAEALFEADEALITRASFDLDTRAATSVPVFYAVLPAVDAGSAWLLARRCAALNCPLQSSDC